MEYLITVFLLLILILPIAKGGFALVFLFCSIICIIYIGLRANQFRNKFIISIFAFSIIWSLISILITSGELASVWDLREYIRVPLSIVILFYYSKTKFFSLNNLTFGFSLIILFDFFALLVFKDNYFSKLFLQSIAMSGMADYLVGYWRHIGIGGNPNFSAMIYSIFIIISAHLLCMKPEMNKLIYFKRALIVVSLFVAVFLLFITFSRTGIIALFLSLGLFFIKPKYLPYISMFFIGLFLFIMFNPETELFIKVTQRFSSFSSASARGEHWRQLFVGYDLLKFFFGYKFESSVIDNDYLYFIYRFGVVLGGLLLILPFYPIFKIQITSTKLMYLNLLVFYYIAALPGGPLSHPKSYFFLLLLGAALVTAKNKKFIKE